MVEEGSKSPMWLQRRRKLWLNLFEKYVTEGQQNTRDCTFSEVSYKLFVKPRVKRNSKLSKINKSKKVLSKRKWPMEDVAPPKPDHNFNKLTYQVMDLKDIETSCLIDENDEIFESNRTNISLNETCKYAKCSCKNKSFQYKENCDNVASVEISIKDIVDYIERDLHSSLKILLVKRGESKILETDKYKYWHECTKSEIKRLKKYVTNTELENCIQFYYMESIDTIQLHNIITNEMGSNLMYLLVQREFARNSSEKYVKYCRKICTEWQRLIRDIRVEYIITYATRVIADCKRSKNRFLAGQADIGILQDQCMLNNSENISDSGIET